MAGYDGPAASRMPYGHMSVAPAFHEVSPLNVNAVPLNMHVGPVPPMHNLPFMPMTMNPELSMNPMKPIIANPAAAAAAVAAAAAAAVVHDRPTIQMPEDVFKALNETETFSDGDMVSTCSNCNHTNAIVDIKWNKAKTKLKYIDEFIQILTKQVNFNLVPSQNRSLSTAQPPLSQSVMCPQPQSDVYNLKSNLSATAQEFRPIQTHKQTNLHHEDQLHQQSHNTAMMTAPVVVTSNKDIYLSHNNNNNNNVNINNNNNVAHNDDSKLRAMSSNEPLLDMNDSATLESGIDSGVHDSGVSDSGVTDPAVTDSVPDRYATHVDDACNVCESDSLKNEKDGKRRAKKKQRRSKPPKSEDGSMDNLLCDGVNDKNFEYPNITSSSTTSDPHYNVAGRTGAAIAGPQSTVPRHRSGSSGKGMQQSRGHMSDNAGSVSTVGSGSVSGERARPHLAGKPQRNAVDSRRPTSRNNNYSNRDDTITTSVGVDKRNGVDHYRSITERNERIPPARGPRNVPGPNIARRSNNNSTSSSNNNNNNNTSGVNDPINNGDALLPSSVQRGPSVNRRSNNGNGSPYPYNSNSNNNNNNEKFTNNGAAAGSGNATKSSYGSVIREEEGNLFSAPADFSLAHCVAEDLRMGAGIAVQFRKEFQSVGELCDQRKKVGQVALLQKGNRYIFYLITKQYSSGKPTLNDMHRTLLELREECLRLGVKKLAMPRIGCGLDRLLWRDVRDMLNETFSSTEIEVVVYNFKEEDDLLDSPSSSTSHSKNTSSNAMKGPPVRYRGYPLINIEAWTALVVFGTTSGYMDKGCQSINSKHTFKQQYLDQCHKTPGEIIQIQAPSQEYVFVFLIREKETDPFSFKNLENCVIHLNAALKKCNLKYVGFDYVTDPEDPVINEKVVTIFRNRIYPGIEIYVCNDPSSSQNSSSSPKFNAIARRS